MTRSFTIFIGGFGQFLTIFIELTLCILLDSFQVFFAQPIANEYRERPGQIVYSPCDESYKDWNDQLLDKKMYTNEDIIETAIDGTDGEYREIKDDFEDNQKKEKSEEDSEEHKHHFRR